MVSAETNEPVAGFPEQHSLKNALHTFEHALVSQILAQQLQGEPVNLHFAWQDNPAIEQIYPYFYQGRVVGFRETKGTGSGIAEVAPAV